ncbi:MAG: InlB B-repeat-containing protein, partial [Paludibacteraceae bacterium]|nr:InlB B-repeat-containing protein [Paludibacteraceae bacterium]
MKLKQLFTAVCLLFFSISISAQEYCLTAPVGYGSSATGGAGGTVVTVTSSSALMSALAKSGKYIILVDGTLTFNSLQSVKATDKTVIGLKGAKIYAPGQSSSASGAIYFKDGSKNIIIRNLTFEGPGAYDCDGDDLLCFDGVTNAWVDHCDFQDGCDGNFDNKGNTDNITVSWCRFRYLKEPKAGGSGGSDDHRYTNLIGSNSSDKPSDGKYNITWAYCWWDEGCVERMTRCRNANLHFLNCYWKSSVAKCYIGPENVTCYLDGCTMEGSISTANRFKSYGGTNGLKSVDCSGVPSNTGSVSAPSYSYTPLSAAEAKTAVTNTTCGAGATLNVSVSGSTVTVLSPCNSTSYTITFNANGGSGTMANQTVYENMATTINANAFTRSGYAFQGWATSSGSSTVTYTNKASITLTKNITLYAVWKEAQTYTVTFNANGGSCSTTSLTYTDGGDPLTLPIPTLNGMVCTGWFTAASGGTKVGAAGADYTPTANVTLYAQWAEAPPCFVPGTATLGSGKTATLADGTKVTMESCTVNETNVAVGASILFEFPNTISAFSFTATCGSDGKNNYYSLNGNDEVALAASTKAAQTYEIPISGNVTSVKIRKSGTTPTISEICYSLNGSSSATTYTITYNTNGGSAIAQTTGVTKLPNPLPTPTKSGATFEGWYTNSGLTVAAVAGSTISANTTLYAKWATNSTYNVTVNAATNGTVSASKTTGVNEGETITLTVTPATGYKVGTITVKDASDNNITLSDNKFIMPASNVTISATFTQISTGSGGCEEGTVGIITTTGASGEGERTMQTVDNITVTHQVVSTTSGAIAEYTNSDKAMYYASSTAIYSKGAYKWNVNTNSIDIETANNTVGYQVDVADGFTYSLSSLDFQMAASCAMVYKIAICNSTETLYLSDEFTITNYNKATAINYNQKIDLSGNSKVQSLTGSFVVKVYLKFGSTGKYFCFPNFTITGNVCSTATSSCTKPTFAWTTAPADGKVGNADITLGVNKGSSTGEVTYTSSDPSVATVIDGKLHYVAPGTTTITATLATDGTYCESSLAEEIEVTLSTYTLSYNLNGHGTAIANAIVNTLPNPLPEPTEAGWTFDGWYTNESLTTPATPGATISANTTLYAKWVENTYNVTINSATNGSVSVNKTEGIKANETVTLTISPNANYELESLVVKDASNKDVTVTNNTFSMPSSNVTISATFAQKSPTLVLTSGSASQTVNVNAAISTIKYTASGSAASIKVDGLPNGVTATISGLVATISGKPSEVGTFNFSVTATNNESKTTVLSGKIVVNAVAPVITKPASTTISATQGVAITPITFSSDVAATFNVTGLPEGLSATTAADGKSVTISGTPTGYGSSNFTVSATAYGKTSSVSGSVTVAQKLPTLV